MTKSEWWKPRIDESQVLRHLSTTPQTPGDLIRRDGLAEKRDDAGAFLTTLRDLVADGVVASAQMDCGAGCFVPAFFLDMRREAAKGEVK